MDAGAAIFFTDYSIGPAALDRALEERGFGSLWAPDRCVDLMRPAQS